MCQSSESCVLKYEIALKQQNDRDKTDAGCELAKLAARLGDIRRTWYGDKVWDVKSVENAKVLWPFSMFRSSRLTRRIRTSRTRT